jgi:hypothetical protein
LVAPIVGVLLLEADYLLLGGFLFFGSHDVIIP